VLQTVLLLSEMPSQSQPLEKILQILCTHVCKWKNKTCWNYSRKGWERG
jgi:hypothetical protein